MKTLQQYCARIVVSQSWRLGSFQSSPLETFYTHKVAMIRIFFEYFSSPCQLQCPINVPHPSITILKAHNWLASYLSMARWVSRCSFTSDPLSGGNQGTIWMLCVHMSMHMCTSLAYGSVMPCNYKYLLHTKVANGTESHKLYICCTYAKAEIISSKWRCMLVRFKFKHMVIKG
jgi:hypothetical protein